MGDFILPRAQILILNQDLNLILICAENLNLILILAIECHSVAWSIGTDEYLRILFFE